MSDTMFYGVLRMPYSMAMADEISRVQFYNTAQQAATRCSDAEALVDAQTRTISEIELAHSNTRIEKSHIRSHLEERTLECSHLRRTIEEMQIRMGRLISEKADAEARCMELAQTYVAQVAAEADAPEFRALAEDWAGRYHSGFLSSRQSAPAAYDKMVAHTAAAVAQARNAGYVDGYTKATVEHNQRRECIPEPDSAQASAPVTAMPTDEQVAQATVGKVHPGDFPISSKNRDVDFLRYDGALVRAYLAAPQQHAQAALSDEQHQNLELVIARLEQIAEHPVRHIDTKVLAEQALPCARAILASQQPVAAPELPIVLELPEGDTRTAKIVWHEVKDGKRYICISISDPAPVAAAAKVAQPEFSRDPDGDLALDWVVGDASLSVSFSKAGVVSWATNVAGKSECGEQRVQQDSGCAITCQIYGHVVGHCAECNVGDEAAADISGTNKILADNYLRDTCGTKQHDSMRDAALLKDARHRIANLSRVAVPFDDPLDGPVLRRLDSAITTMAAQPKKDN